MKRYTLICLVLYGMVQSGTFAVAQCQADSVFYYGVLYGVQTLEMAEYSTYDENDSLTKRTTIQFNQSGAQPLYEYSYSRVRSKGTQVYEDMANWSADRGGYKATAIKMSEYNKKGQLVVERYELAGTKSIPQTELRYVYNKSGKLAVSILYQWDSISKTWQNSMYHLYQYDDTVLISWYAHTWDTVAQKWQNDWRHFFEYDSLGVLAQVSSYELSRDAWVPRSRTVYGVDPEKPVRWNVQQTWNGAAENWTNVSYYVFQLNEKKWVEKEIHLKWENKAWVLDATYQYLYTDDGKLRAILNDNGITLVERFCRN